MSKGRLLVIEGLDGSGKATQAKLLAAHLAESGCKVMEITFPDYESDSSALVKMYSPAGSATSPTTSTPMRRPASMRWIGTPAIRPGGAASTRRAASSSPTATPRRTRCISAPSSRRSSGTTSSAGPLTTNTGCWACPRRTRGVLTGRPRREPEAHDRPLPRRREQEGRSRKGHRISGPQPPCRRVLRGASGWATVHCTENGPCAPSRRFRPRCGRWRKKSSDNRENGRDTINVSFDAAVG